MYTRSIRTIFACALIIGFMRGWNGISGAPVDTEGARDNFEQTNGNHLQKPLAPQATPLQNTTQITTGDSHACALTTTGGVKCWGSNEYGQLGDGTNTQRSIPVDVVGLASGVIAVAAGGEHTCAVTVGGGVKCWGMNYHGQIGDGTGNNLRLIPVDVTGLSSGVTSVALGRYHTCAITTGKALKCWGYNYYGQLGNGEDFSFETTPIDVSTMTSDVAGIAGGMFHTCAYKTSGLLFCWGLNSKGQLGNGNTANSNFPNYVSGFTPSGQYRASSVSAGAYHTCATTNSGGVKCWGDNSAGQLGDGTTNQHLTPVDVSGLNASVAFIEAGSNHTCALLSSGGGAKCWGRNANGELGDGTTINRLTPVDVNGLTGGISALAAGGLYSCAMTISGGVKCWGSNRYGQLGNGTIVQYPIPMDVNSLINNITALALGNNHTCGLTDTGGVKCWGANNVGQLGDGTTISRSTPTVVTGLTSSVKALAAGDFSTCAVMMSGAVKCWGNNSYGQLGDGTTINRLTPVDVSGLSSGVESIAADGYQACVLTANGGVKCWGSNEQGQLGDGTKVNRLTPVDVSGLSSGVLSVAVGYLHSCAITTGGGAKCWGYNNGGRLGDGTDYQRSLPVDVVGLSSGVTTMELGESQTCAIITGGGVKCWGGNIFGEVGNGSTTPQYTPVDVTGLTTGGAGITTGSYNSCALLASGAAKCWGYNPFGQLGDGSTAQRLTPIDVTGLAGGVSALTGGYSHTCAILTNGRVKCWGWDGFGQLGLGTVTQSLTHVDVVTAAPPRLWLNYTYGRPGSFFTLTGGNFPANSQGSITVNGSVLTTNLAVNETGGFLLFLDTSGADDGIYVVTVEVNPSISTTILLDSQWSLRLQEGGGEVLQIPPGIGVLPKFIYLPLVDR